MSSVLSSQDVHSDSSLILTKAYTGPEGIGRQTREEREGKSNKEFNLEAVGFRTYEAPLFEVLQESGHAQFMALIGLTQFLGLSWTHVHRALATEFLKNYRKNKSSRISLSSSVRSKKITLNKKLIASTFHLSSIGYKHKNQKIGKQAVSSLFDPVAARRNGYYIRDCKDPAYFERLEALNRLICFKPPGHLISATLVDVAIHAAVQPVDWAGLLFVSLMKELDRVTSSLRQAPCTLVGVHICLILSNLKILRPEDSLALESFPYALLDGYSTANSFAYDSLPSSPLPGSPRPSEPGAGLAEVLGFTKGVQKPPNVRFSRSFLADALVTNIMDQKSSTVPCGSIGTAPRDTPSHAESIGAQKPSTIPFGSVHSATKCQLSLAAGVRLYLKKILQCFKQCASAA